MKSETLIDYAVFQLSPKHSRCELFVSSNGKMEKLASGLVKPFVTHLKVAEEQVALSVESIKLEVGRRRNAEPWFTKGTLERFVRFVSTPEILELVITFDAETSQLETAQRLYSQEAGDQLSGPGGGASGIAAASDATKKELLRAIDVRLAAVKQDLTIACTRAAAAGFYLETVAELQMFADQFGAHRLNEACSKFISLCERRPALIPYKVGTNDHAVCSSYGSDMSINEDPTTPDQLPTGLHQRSHNHPARQVAESTQPSLSQQSKPSSTSFPLCRSRELSIEKVDSQKETEATDGKERKEESSCDQAKSTHGSRHVRRLSVQDRISLFENKQKDSSGTGEKPVVGKSAELRRQTSDVPEKAVLRSLSGAGDMSIDLSGEEKDTETPFCTPSSISASLAKKEEQKVSSLSDSARSDKPECRSGQPTVKSESEKEVIVGAKQVTISSSTSAGAIEADMLTSNLSTAYRDDWKDQVCEKPQSKSAISQAEDNKDQAFLPLSGSKTEINDFSYQGKFRKPHSSHELNNITGRENSEAQLLKDQWTPQRQFKAFARKGNDFRPDVDSQKAVWYEYPNEKELQLSDQLPSHSVVKEPQRNPVVGEHSEGSTLKNQVSLASHYKDTEGDSTTLVAKCFLMKTEEAEKKEVASSDKLISSSLLSVEDSRPPKMKFEQQHPEQEKKILTGRDVNHSVYGNNMTIFTSKIVAQPPQGPDSSTPAAASQGQRVRQSKGGQELNDELKTKANELEKLFAEHKLRVPGDSSSTHRSRVPYMLSESVANLSYHTPLADSVANNLIDSYRSNGPAGSSNNTANFDASPQIMTLENQNYENVLNKKNSGLGFSEGSRGKFYDSYGQKRNEKLQEEWSSRRAEKEAKLKCMQDSFEHSRAEMKAKFSGSADRQDLVSTARRAERLRFFNTNSHMGREQLLLDFGQSGDDEDFADIEVPKSFGKDRSCTDSSFGDDLSRSAAGKKLLPSRSSSSSTPRTSAGPVPRSATKASNSSSGRQKLQSANPLAQSVPSFTELRKENTKLTAAATKTKPPQLRNYSRSKGTNEEASLVKEAKSRPMQSLRKSSASPGEVRETSPLKSEVDDLSPLKFEEETVVRKGRVKDFSAVTGVVEQKTSLAADPLNNKEEYDYLAFGLSNSKDIVDDDKEEEFETMGDEDHANLGNREGGLSHGSETVVNSEAESGEPVGSYSYVHPSFGAKVPTVSSFHPIESMQYPFGGSPVSWNSRAHNPFSYLQELSDVDASADSPVGSPMSWNSHSLSQMETDAARMRKKWGTAQKPVLITNSSNNQSRKDMPKGLKRLLKFGRKNRGTENLVDWISATSYGDDDTEDGRDSGNRSSEDQRKSGIGLGHPSDDSFNQSEYFNEQVQTLQSSIPAPPANFKLREDHLSGSSIKAPRSFFSLSTLRSKGSDSKPR